MERKKGSDAAGKTRDLWSMKRLVSKLKEKYPEVDSRVVVGIDFGTTCVIHQA